MSVPDLTNYDIDSEYNYTVEEFLKMEFDGRYALLKNIADSVEWFDLVKDKKLLFEFLNDMNDRKCSYHLQIVDGLSKGIQEGSNKYFNTQIETLKAILNRMQSQSSNFFVELLLSVLLNFNIIGTVAGIALSKAIRAAAERSKFVHSLLYSKKQGEAIGFVKPYGKPAYIRYKEELQKSSMVIAYERVRDKIQAITGSPTSMPVTQTVASNLRALIASEPKTYDELKNKATQACKILDKEIAVSPADWPGDSVSTAAQISLGTLLEKFNQNKADIQLHISATKLKGQFSFEEYKKIFDLIFKDYEKGEDYLKPHYAREQILLATKQLIYKIILLAVYSVKDPEEQQKIREWLELAGTKTPKVSQEPSTEEYIKLAKSLAQVLSPDPHMREQALEEVGSFNQLPVKFIPIEEFYSNSELIVSIAKTIYVYHNRKMDTIYNHSLEIKRVFRPMAWAPPEDITWSVRVGFMQRTVFYALNETQHYLDDHEFKGLDWFIFKS